MEQRRHLMQSSINQKIADADAIRQNRQVNAIPKMPLINYGCIEILNYERWLYIESYCNDLIRDDELHEATIKVIKECMIVYNVALDKYLVKRETYEYSFNACLIYLMIGTQLFNEEDYYKAGLYEIENVFQVFEILEKLKKEKKRQH